MQKSRAISSYITTYANDFHPVFPPSKDSRAKEPGKPVINLWDIESANLDVGNCSCSWQKKVPSCDDQAWNYLKDARSEYVGKYCFDFDLPAQMPIEILPGAGKLESMKKFLDDALAEEEKTRRREEQTMLDCPAHWINRDLLYDDGLQCKIAELYRTRQGLFLKRKRPRSLAS
ncbi:Hypothetical protein NTJ_02162 [Nesidiocoris tenuis]|uniref:Uncharacterized protein n=1 Tax=Nesidiocoris tenuis TaxID=355587 RepID=A0ABN7AES1_9HEMI|nr:Hypothetical protein NTJ_02162 [Nesidiocoris tenuis]